MADKSSGHWQSEYDWKSGPVTVQASEPDSDSQITNSLCVLFEPGARCQFSSVRIALCCQHDVPLDVRKHWEIEIRSNSSSLTNSVSSNPGSNACSLPTYNAIFIVDCIPSSRRPAYNQARIGIIQFRDEGFSDPLSDTFFEHVQPLTENTHSVSVTFTSSKLISALVQRPRVPFFQPEVTHYAATGRVVRVFPTLPTRNRRTITLPSDVLFVIFENVFDPADPHWRRDVVSCALTCRQWTCALSGGFLFRDFRSRSFQEGRPPNLSTLTAALVAQPHNCRFIKHISPQYFERHPIWSQLPDNPPDPQFPITPLFLHLNVFRQRQNQCARFTDTFVSLLRSLKSVHTLCLDRKSLKNTSLLDLLRNLPTSMNVETLVIDEPGELTKSGTPMAQVLSCIPKWPSIRRLSISGIQERDDYVGGEDIALKPITFPLTEINIKGTLIMDDELMWLIGSSASSLRQLTMSSIESTTNAGLAFALRHVSKSLTYLSMMNIEHQFSLDEGEEYALDTVISDMERLEHLMITPELASELMLERRTRAFQSSHGRPVINLELFVFGWSRDHGIMGAAEMDWPGWEITRTVRKHMQGLYFRGRSVES